MKSLVEEKIEKYLPKNRVKKVIDTEVRLNQFLEERNKEIKAFHEALTKLSKK